MCLLSDILVQDVRAGHTSQIGSVSRVSSSSLIPELILFFDRKVGHLGRVLWNARVQNCEGKILGIST